MRLSKTRKDTIRAFRTVRLSKEELKAIRKERNRINRLEYTIVYDYSKRPNPKHIKRARRGRNPLPGRKIDLYVPSKYPYNPLITKRR